MHWLRWGKIAASRGLGSLMVFHSGKNALVQGHIQEQLSCLQTLILDTWMMYMVTTAPLEVPTQAQVLRGSHKLLGGQQDSSQDGRSQSLAVQNDQLCLTAHVNNLAQLPTVPQRSGVSSFPTFSES